MASRKSPSPSLIHQANNDILQLGNLPEQLADSKSRKHLILTGATRFNTKPSVGIEFLQSNGIIKSDETSGQPLPGSIAGFLKGCPRIDKKLLGDYISKPDHIEILKAFVELMSFKDVWFHFHFLCLRKMNVDSVFFGSKKPVAEALRELLEAFRLPGEAQQIGRIAETFAQCYFETEPG